MNMCLRIDLCNASDIMFFSVNIFTLKRKRESCVCVDCNEILNMHSIAPLPFAHFLFLLIHLKDYNKKEIK